MNLAILASIIIAALAPIGAYVVASRKMSGRINTSDASDLWTEARAIREDYRRQLEEASNRTRDLESRVAKLEYRNIELLRENVELRAKVASLEALVDTLRAHIAELERQ